MKRRARGRASSSTTFGTISQMGIQPGDVLSFPCDPSLRERWCRAWARPQFVTEINHATSTITMRRGPWWMRNWMLWVAQALWS